MKKLACLTLLSLVTTQLSGYEPSGAPIEISFCGQIVTSDAVLTADLVCDTGGVEDAGIQILGSGVTLDMGGHTLSGQPQGIGIRTLNADDVTIRNGTIDRYLSGIDIYDGRGLTVTDMTIRNLQVDDPDEFLIAIRVNDSQDVLIKDSLFEFLPVAHKNGMHIANSGVIVDNIEMIDGGVGYLCSPTLAARVMIPEHIAGTRLETR